MCVRFHRWLDFFAAKSHKRHIRKDFMMRLLTDSTADLTEQMKQDWKVSVLPLSVHFGQESFLDGVDITNEQFYEKLQMASELPTTSQLNPAQFEQVFQEAKQAGEQVLCLVLSSALSGTYQSAMIAKDMVNYDGIFVVDLQCVTLGSALLIHQAHLMIEQGLSAPEIVQKIDQLKEKVRVYAMVDTLKYLKMGGRISATTALVGGVLGICPIVGVVGGKVENLGKAKGKAAAKKWLLDKIAQDDVNLQLPLCVADINNKQGVAEIKKGAMQATNITQCFEINIGSTVGTHVGPGAIGLAYFVK